MKKGEGQERKVKKVKLKGIRKNEKEEGKTGSQKKVKKGN
jgi:hypothetical protein